ncbi:MAG: hypothetical protein U0354_09550 [Candidatus Sericytochromatia bacterium]
MKKLKTKSLFILILSLLSSCMFDINLNTIKQDKYETINLKEDISNVTPPLVDTTPFPSQYSSYQNKNMRKIFYQKSNKQIHELYSINYDGTNNHKILIHNFLLSPIFNISPDSNKIIYIDKNNTDYNLNWFELNISDLNKKMIYSRTPRLIARAFFSKDSKKIIFPYYSNSIFNSNYSIYDTKSGEIRELNKIKKTILSVSYSKILFLGDNNNIYISDFNETNVIRVNNIKYDWFSSFKISNDESKIYALSLDKEKSEANLVLMNIDGTYPKILIHNCYNFELSPNEKQVSYISSQNTLKIYDIEKNVLIKTLNYDSIFSLKYSDDSKKIAFNSKDKIMIFNSDGTYDKTLNDELFIDDKNKKLDRNIEFLKILAW